MICARSSTPSDAAVIIAAKKDVILFIDIALSAASPESSEASGMSVDTGSINWMAADDVVAAGDDGREAVFLPDGSDTTAAATVEYD